MPKVLTKNYWKYFKENLKVCLTDVDIVTKLPWKGLMLEPCGILKTQKKITLFSFFMKNGVQNPYQGFATFPEFKINMTIVEHFFKKLWKQQKWSKVWRKVHGLKKELSTKTENQKTEMLVGQRATLKLFFHKITENLILCQQKVISWQAKTRKRR